MLEVHKAAGTGQGNTWVYTGVGGAASENPGCLDGLETQTVDKHKQVEAKAQVRGTLKWWNGCRYTSETFEVWHQMQAKR